MAISHLGSYGTISDIDTPTTDPEITMSLWYDVALQTFLKISIPNFAMARKRVAQVSETPPYPFLYSYEYPSDCLKVLGIGAVEDKKNNYTVEGRRIYTDVLYDEGLPLRYIKHYTDVTTMSPEFKVSFSWYLASLTCLEITQDKEKMKFLEEIIPQKISNLSGMNAQENMPIRKSVSKFKESRRTGYATDQVKR